MTTLADNSDYIIFRETASVTTAKTTLGHVAAVEARDAVYTVGLWERTGSGATTVLDLVFEEENYSYVQVFNIHTVFRS